MRFTPSLGSFSRGAIVAVSDDGGPFLVFSSKLVERLLFLRLSPLGYRSRNIFGFVPVDSVSSTSTLRSFEMRSTCKGCFARQPLCQDISLDSLTEKESPE